MWRTKKKAFVNGWVGALLEHACQISVLPPKNGVSIGSEQIWGDLLGPACTR